MEVMASDVPGGDLTGMAFKGMDWFIGLQWSSKDRLVRALIGMELQ